MATRPELPADVAAALDRAPEARDRFAALPAERRLQWLSWIDRARTRRGRAARIDELMRRLLPAAETEEIAEPAAPPPERYWWLWLLLLLLLVVAGLLVWWLLTRGDDKSTVPDVIGLKSRVAAQRIHDKDLNVSPVTGQSKRPPDVVFAQRPGAGTQLGHGQNVTIFISSGRQSVPDVTGLTAAQAQQRLTAAGLKSQIVRVASSRPKNVVVAQSPAAGVTAASGTVVKLSVSSGAKPVVVPQVVGQSQGSAVNALTAAGLKPALNNVGSAKPAGTVVAQKPAAGKEVDKGSKVTLNVSTGTPSTTTTTNGTTTTTGGTSTTTGPVTVPRVTGLAAAPALRSLSGRNLAATIVYQQSSQPAGRVLKQAPAAGASARGGSHVRLTVSTGPNPQPSASVPDVSGEDQATAADDLRSAGFRVIVLNRKTTDQTQDGQVVEQTPSAGASIPGGVLVAIYIGRFTG
jgi:beta-lactam-binding protein with PASTA domain